MAANTSPIYSKLGVIGWATLTAANTAADGTGTTATIFTADVTNGGRVDRLRIKPLGTNVVSVLRIFINNGASSAVAANNTLYGEVTLPASSVSQIAAQTDIDYLMGYTGDLNGGLALPPGYKLLIALGTAVAAGYAVSALGGSY